jgi:DNA modification methylase
MSYSLLRADARHLPLADASVDLIVTSPPYFGQRSYQDGGEHYDGQIGSEPTPREFLDALAVVMAECKRVLKPSGSCFVNLGDKRAGSGAPGTTSGLAALDMPGDSRVQGDRSEIATSYPQSWLGRRKGKQLLPHRFAIECMDADWIVRQDIVWSKLNGLPESVKDRTRDSHEYWFHLVKEESYFAGIDLIREPHTGGTHPSGPNAKAKWVSGEGVKHRQGTSDPEKFNQLGKVPGSVWPMATEPLAVPDELGIEHFAAFPSEWPRRLILGWCPTGICTECGDGRFPVVDTEAMLYREAGATRRQKRADLGGMGGGVNTKGYPQTITRTTIAGYACACTPMTYHPERRRRSVSAQDGANQSDMAARDELGLPRHHGDDWPERLPIYDYHLDQWTPAPTRPAIVLDPFGGTGTTAAVAHALGHHGISIDLSADYQRLARWRIEESGLVDRVHQRTIGRRLNPEPPSIDGQLSLLG